MGWQTGSEEIGRLLTNGELERVAPDAAVSRRLLADAERHFTTAESALAGEDHSGAYQLAYDGLRKSAAALLAVQGLRATSRGGHIAVQDAVVAQFGGTVHVLRSFGRIRRGRNQFEYPDSESSTPTTDDVRDAIDVARQTHHAATTILNQEVLTPW